MFFLVPSSILSRSAARDFSFSSIFVCDVVIVVVVVVAAADDMSSNFRFLSFSIKFRGEHPRRAINIISMDEDQPSMDLEGGTVDLNAIQLGLDSFLQKEVDIDVKAFVEHRGDIAPEKIISRRTSSQVAESITSPVDSRSSSATNYDRVPAILVEEESPAPARITVHHYDQIPAAVRSQERPTPVYDRLPALTSTRDGRGVADDEATNYGTVEQDGLVPTQILVFNDSTSVKTLQFAAVLVHWFGEFGGPMTEEVGADWLSTLQYRSSLIACNLLLLTFGHEIVQLSTSRDFRQSTVCTQYRIAALTKWAPLYVCATVCCAWSYLVYAHANWILALVGALLALLGLQSVAPWFAQTLPNYWLPSVVGIALLLAPALVHVSRLAHSRRLALPLAAGLCVLSALPAAAYLAFWGAQSDDTYFS
jgi:hypothetical protein